VQQKINKMKQLGPTLSLSALLLVTTLLAACSSADSDRSSLPPPPHPPTTMDTVRSRLEGQGIAILPLDQQNAACSANPTTMDVPTFASCTHLEVSKLPAQLSITDDATTFDPNPEKAMILVVKVIPVEAEIASTPETWHALIGLGKLKDLESGSGAGAGSGSSGGSLVNPGSTTGRSATPGIHPNAVFLLAPAAPMLVAATEALIVAGIAFFGAKAVVATAEQISKSRQESLVRSTEQALVEQAELLCKTYTCDGSSKECAGRPSGTPCKYADENGTTYGSGSGFCGGTRSFSAIRDAAGKATGQCTAPCVCRDARSRR
jgi:hypothetical protein